MITNKGNEHINVYTAPRQRLGNKTLYTTVVPNQNNTNVRYFSGIDAEIYFGDVFIDETTSISFNVQQNALPLYGYNSYVYDDIALGSRIINGQFSINFTKSAYMYEVLDTLAALNNNNRGNFTKSISSRGPLWNKKFDIYMSYGDAKQSNRVANSTILVIKDVSLVSCAQELDYTGKPIMETYSFVARDIDFLTEGEYEEATNQTSKVEDTMPIVNVKYFTRDNQAHLTFNFADGIKIKGLEYKLTGANAYTNAFENESSNKDGVYVDTNIVSQYTEIRDTATLLNGLNTDSLLDSEYGLELLVTYVDSQEREHTNFEMKSAMTKQNM